MAGFSDTSLLGKGKSESKSRYIIPEVPQFGEYKNQFGQFQGGITDNSLQRGAVDEQRNLRSSLDTLLSDYGNGERNRINQDFETAANNAVGGLASRGFAGSSLNIPASLGVERERTRAHGQLNDQLLGKRIDSETGISNSISDLLFGSSGQATDLIGRILGTGGIGNDSSSETAAPGGGGGGGSSSSEPIAPSPYNPIYDPASPIYQNPGGGFGGGNSGGGGGGGSGGGQGGGSQLINNPFAPPSLGQPAQAAPPGLRDPDGDPDSPENWGPLNDGGLIQDPEAFKENQEELKRRQAILDAMAAGATGADIAQSAGGTAGQIASGGSMV